MKTKKITVLKNEEKATRIFKAGNKILAEIDFSGDRCHLFLKTSKNGGLGADYNSAEEVYYRANDYIENLFPSFNIEYVYKLV